MNTSFALFLVLLLLGLPALGSLIMWAVFRLMGVGVTKVALVGGPALVTFRLFDTTMTIGCSPFGGGVDMDLPVFEQKPLLLRLALRLGWPLLLLGAAVCLLGSQGALHHLFTGFSQLISGALHPLSIAQHLITRVEMVHALSAPTAVGILAAKYASLMVLPCTSFTPALCLREVVDPLRKHKMLDHLIVFNAIVALAAAVSWLVALVAYAWTGRV